MKESPGLTKSSSLIQQSNRAPGGPGEEQHLLQRSLLGRHRVSCAACASWCLRPLAGGLRASWGARVLAGTTRRPCWVRSIQRPCLRDWRRGGATAACAHSRGARAPLCFPNNNNFISHVITLPSIDRSGARESNEAGKESTSRALSRLGPPTVHRSRRNAERSPQSLASTSLLLRAVHVPRVHCLHSHRQ